MPWQKLQQWWVTDAMAKALTMVDDQCHGKSSDSGGPSVPWQKLWQWWIINAMAKALTVVDDQSHTEDPSGWLVPWQKLSQWWTITAMAKSSDSGGWSKPWQKIQVGDWHHSKSSNNGGWLMPWQKLQLWWMINATAKPPTMVDDQCHGKSSNNGGWSMPWQKLQLWWMINAMAKALTVVDEMIPWQKIQQTAWLKAWQKNGQKLQQHCKFISAVTLHCCCWLSLAKADQTPPLPAHTQKSRNRTSHPGPPTTHTLVEGRFLTVPNSYKHGRQLHSLCTSRIQSEDKIKNIPATLPWLPLPSFHPPPPPPPSISHTISLIHYSQLCHAVGRHTHYYYWVLIFFHSFLRFSAHFQGCGEAKRRAPTHAVLAQSWVGGGVLTDEARNTNVAHDDEDHRQ